MTRARTLSWLVPAMKRGAGAQRWGVCPCRLQPDTPRPVCPSVLSSLSLGVPLCLPIRQSDLPAPHPVGTAPRTPGLLHGLRSSCSTPPEASPQPASYSNLKVSRLGSLSHPLPPPQHSRIPDQGSFHAHSRCSIKLLARPV